MRKLYCLLLGALLFSFSSLVIAQSIHWQSYSTALEQAKKQNKLVLLFGKATWCPWCHKMQNQVFTNGKVIGVVNKYFIPVKIDADSNAAIANKFSMSSFPTLIILKPNQQVVKRHSGFLSSGETASFLNKHAGAS